MLPGSRQIADFQMRGPYAPCICTPEICYKDCPHCAMMEGDFFPTAESEPEDDND